MEKLKKKSLHKIQRYSLSLYDNGELSRGDTLVREIP